MRVILAAIFVVIGLSSAVLLITFLLPHPSRLEDILIEVGIAALFVALLAAAIFLLGDETGKLAQGFDQDQYIHDLEDKGLLISTDYQAVRAFQLEEYEDEGSHYFVELADRTVLYLTGQNLYEYEPIDNDPELNQPRRFPCTEFSLRSQRNEKGYIDIQCRGTVIEPEFVEPHPKHFWKRGLEDGEIITNLSFDEIKAELINEGRARK